MPFLIARPKSSRLMSPNAVVARHGHYWPSDNVISVSARNCRVDCILCCARHIHVLLLNNFHSFAIAILHIVCSASDSMILWTSKWGVGGSGQIDLEKGIHGLSRRSWVFRLLFPKGCYLSTAKFWHACIVESLTEPENGLFTFRQVRYIL